MKWFKKISKEKPLWIFYIMLAYILTSFCWWTYLHINNIGEIKQLKIEKTTAENKLQYAITKAENPREVERAIESGTYGKTADKNGKGIGVATTTLDEYKKEYNKKKRMIAGEGIVFLLLLLFGSYRTHKGMQNEIELNRKQRNFLLSITHELKSPLASIHLNTETMIKRNLDKLQQSKLLSNTLKDTKRLKALVENILMAAKIENQDITLAKQDTNFTTTVQEIANRLKNISVNQSHNFELNIAPNIFVFGDRLALVSIITNLIENAVKYTPKGSTISVSLAAEGKSTKLMIADDGNGVSDLEKTKIFDKFYRTGNEDTRKTKGTGLGLYLVKQLVEFHKGTIKVVDNQPKGALFIVEIPRIIPTRQLRSVKNTG